MVKYIVHFVSYNRAPIRYSCYFNSANTVTEGFGNGAAFPAPPIPFCFRGDQSLSYFFVIQNCHSSKRLGFSIPSKLPVFQKTNNWSLRRAFVAFCPTSIMDKTNILEYQTYSMLYKALTKVNKDYLAHLLEWGLVRVCYQMHIFVCTCMNVCYV